MNPVARLGAYGLLLAVVFGGGALVGAAVGPIDTGAEADPHGAAHGATPDGSSHEATPDRSTHEATPADDAAPVAGLRSSQDGYAFVPGTRTLGAGPFTFRITGPDGEPVTSYEVLHDRQLHLIVASRDLRHYAHLHPTRAADGTWSVEVPALPAGAYRAFADFRPAGGEQLTLGVDLSVLGPTAGSEPIEPVDHDHVAGFDVDLAVDGGTATVTVRRDGEVVTTQPYLGAAGHLVALRDGDLAYLHVHPLDDVPAGPVRFAVEHPSAGRYALFFDFQVDGQVHTARFVVDASDATSGHDDADHGGH